MLSTKRALSCSVSGGGGELSVCAEASDSTWLELG